MLETVLLLFATLVLVPLGLRLIEDPSRWPLAVRLLTAAKWLQPAAAVSLGASFALKQSWPAAALAGPWFVVTLLLAGVGLLDAVRRGWRLDASAGFTAALLFSPVGGSWAVLSRAGLRPQDFSHAIVLLTAVHFHYAGFLLPVIASCVVRRLQEQAGAKLPARIDGLMLLGILVGVPAVGLGISLSAHIEVGAAVVLACACVGLAIRQMQAVLGGGLGRVVPHAAREEGITRSVMRTMNTGDRQN